VREALRSAEDHELSEVRHRESEVEATEETTHTQRERIWVWIDAPYIQTAHGVSLFEAAIELTRVEIEGSRSRDSSGAADLMDRPPTIY
jgi:hypothetical protein